MAQHASSRDATRASLENEIRSIFTVGDLMDFVETLHPPELRHLFVDTLTCMATWPKRRNGRWIDRQELAARHVGYGSIRARTLSRTERFNSKVFAMIVVRIRAAEGYKSEAVAKDAESILALLGKHEWDNRKG